MSRAGQRCSVPARPAVQNYHSRTKNGRHLYRRRPFAILRTLSLKDKNYLTAFAGISVLALLLLPYAFIALTLLKFGLFNLPDLFWRRTKLFPREVVFVSSHSYVFNHRLPLPLLPLCEGFNSSLDLDDLSTIVDALQV